MKTRKLKQVKQSKSADGAKLSLVIEKLEKKIESSAEPPGSCRRIYCIPAV